MQYSVVGTALSSKVCGCYCVAVLSVAAYELFWFEPCVMDPRWLGCPVLYLDAQDCQASSLPDVWNGLHNLQRH